MSHRIRRVQQLPVVPAPLVGRFGLFAEHLEVRTNDARILAGAEASFGRFAEPAAAGAALAVASSSAPLVAGRCARERGRRAAPDERAPDARALVHEPAGHLLAIGLGTTSRAVV